MPKHTNRLQMKADKMPEELFSAILDIAHDAIIAINQNQNIVLFNQGAKQIFGYNDADEVIGKPLDMLLPSNLSEVHRAHVREFAESATKSRNMGAIEISGRRKDGTVFPAQASIAKVAEGKETIFTVILRDITERVRVEEEIQEKNQFLSESQRIAHIGGWIWDMKGPIQWTEETYRIYGVSQEVFTPTIESFVNLIHPEDRPAMQRWIEACSAGQAPDKLEFRAILPDGSVRFLSGRGELIYDTENRPAFITGTVQDVTQRKQIAEVLHASEEKYRTLVNEISEGIFATDEQGVNVFANPALARMLGFNAPEELLGTNFIEFIAPDNLNQIVEEFGRVMAGGQTREAMEVELVRRDGTHIVGKITASILLKDGQIVGTQGLIRDITAHKQAEERLRRSSLIAIRNRVSKITIEVLLIVALSGVVFSLTYYYNLLDLVELYAHTQFLTHKTLDGLITTFGVGALAYIVFSYRRWLEIREDVVVRQKVEDDLRTLQDELERRVQERTANLVKANQDLTIQIEKRKQAEKELSDSYDFLNIAGQIAKIGSWELDLETQNLRWSDEVYQIHEVDPATKPNVAEAINFYAPESQPIISAAVQAAIDSNTPYDLELQLITAKGRHIWIRAQGAAKRLDGKTVGLYGAFQDITKQKQAEQSIESQLHRLETLRSIEIAIASSHDLRLTLKIVVEETIARLNVDTAAILLFDPASNMLEFAAGKGFRTENMQKGKLRLGEGLVGRAAIERKRIEIPNLAEVLNEFIRAPLFAGEDFISYYSVPLIAKGQLMGILEIFHRAPLTPDGEGLEFLETLARQAAIAIDNGILFENLQRSKVELEHRVEERTFELYQTNAELEHANRAKDMFLANMSHELRTPLNSILGLSESLLEQRRDPLSENQQKYLQMVNSSGRHLLDLINDILDLSKIEAGKLDYYPETIGIADLCRSSLAFVKSQAMKKSINLTYEEDKTISKIHADPRRLKQVLVNLLTNAVKFTPEHGQVTLEVHADAKEDLIQFSVIDTGIGIAPDDLKRLFQPFAQVDSRLNREQEGSGLGLSLVSKLTDLHGGSVHVESEVGQGSNFTIILPWRRDLIVRPETIQSGDEISTQARTLSSGPPKKQGAILLAEDNMANILTIGEYLESYGYEITVAHNGIEAIEKAEEINPDMILMDIQMPVMDGLEATRRLRANPSFKTTPIIALTALAMPGDRERCIEAGANEYLSKPVSLKGLVKTIGDLLA